jgi:nitroimidazol reductase NimA-like FMN-containing flavoprotein (pyridoxamine 5'-phosphate oxidase superfamily)
MMTKEVADQECRVILTRASIGRLGCSLNDQPYVVPVYFAYEPDYIYVFSAVGQKIEWMRRNPKVCMQVDEISNESQWVSVIANGTYQELPAHSESPERRHAQQLLEKRQRWWLNAIAERRAKVDDLSIDEVFFCIRILSMHGLRAQARPRRQARIE